MAKHKRRGWSDADKQAFADGRRDRATTFTDRRKQSDRKACRNFRWQG